MSSIGKRKRSQSRYSSNVIYNKEDRPISGWSDPCACLSECVSARRPGRASQWSVSTRKGAALLVPELGEALAHDVLGDVAIELDPLAGLGVGDVVALLAQALGGLDEVLLRLGLG